MILRQTIQEANLMEIRTLRYFLAVAHEENMTKAAEILHVIQPTLSKALKALEDELGKKLFTRHSFRIALTEEGLLLRERAEDLVKMADKIESEFLSLNDVSDEGTLAVSSYANYSLSWLWPYESGDDSYDTWLGNRAVDEDLSVKIIIHVMACYDENVKTGDDTNSYLYTASIILACIVLAVFVIWYAKRRKKQQQAA